METLFRKVLVSERVPTKNGTYLTDKGKVKYSKSRGFYIDSIISINKSVKAKYWLEPIQLPSEEDIKAINYPTGQNIGIYKMGFFSGINYILGFINNKK